MFLSVFWLKRVAPCQPENQLNASMGLMASRPEQQERHQMVDSPLLPKEFDLNRDR